MRSVPAQRLRDLHGASTAVWVGDGRHEVGTAHWLALSGAMHADFNLALFHGPAGESALSEHLPTIVGRRRPSIVALAGQTRETAVLREAGWVRVGGAPLMVRSTAGERVDPVARPLVAAEVSAARDLVARVFALPPDIAGQAVPDDVAGVERALWGAFDGDRLVSSLIAVRVEDALVIWSMATAQEGRRRGFGARLLGSVLADGEREGARICLLHASAAGEPFYLSMGFGVVERWDFWSRRRWVLAAQ